MNPFQQFVRGLAAAKLEYNETIDELLAFAEVLARKQNTLEMDENGFFYVTASGQIEEVIAALQLYSEKLQRIKKQKDSSH